MSKASMSTPKGRIEINFPDDMSLEELTSTLSAHLLVLKQAKDKPHNPPVTGRDKVILV